MDLDLNQYMGIFVEDAREHLQDMNEALLALERDIDNIDIVNEIFRVAHTLKGMAGTMGFEDISNLTHEMENVLHGIRSNLIVLDEDTIDIIFESFDALDHAIDFIAANGREGEEDYKDLIDRLRSISFKTKPDSTHDELHDKLDSMDGYTLRILNEARIEGLSSYRLDIILDANCMLKAARAFIIFNALDDMGEIISSNPPVEDIEDEKFDLKFTIIFISQLNHSRIMDELNAISEIESISLEEICVEDILANIGELDDMTIDSGGMGKVSSRDDKESRTTDNRGIVGKTVRVDIDRLDNLMNLVSELIIIKTRMDELSQSSDTDKMGETIEYLERITTNIHDAVMKVRMVPIERVFNRFPRMVRDLSRELEKKIELQMTGKETEVDRTVIDEIGEPLIHIIRNSIDHGIEDPEERIKHGKSEKGNIGLNAYADGNHVIIEAIDDGRGLDSDRIKEEAIQKGIIDAQEAELLTREESISLLFTPGFSTANEVSGVSGRGVGLDVVKNKIESINGSIELDSQLYRGTKFTIRLPLTLAIIQALLVKLDDEIYAIPLGSITEIIRTTEEDIKNVYDQEVILYRGRTIPIIKLNRILGLDEGEEMEERVVVIARKGEKQAALLVDDLIGQQEIVIKPLGKYLSNIDYLSGATILGNGNISLILDVNSII
ncbi:MAG: chemotaxis protein CheA [Tissierellia bacterium]|nr:chemotaxis protein CheA [Tissierellia bacterium]